jgi:hypothetical protein
LQSWRTVTRQVTVTNRAAVNRTEVLWFNF